MTELERCELAKKNGFTYCKLTGNITGASGRVLNMKKNNGYIGCSIKKDKKIYQVLGHRLAWYLYYGKLPNKFIDHVSRLGEVGDFENETLKLLLNLN